MRLSLIGMSGSGKSTWSVKLAAAGFRRFCCDERIADMLSAELQKSGMPALSLGEWMGFPDEDDYEIRESRYLTCEMAVMGDILDQMETNRGKTDMVVDTTGSAIYTGKNILARLRRCTTVVYLSTPSERKTQMLDAYLANQRPVVWNGMFEKSPDESRDHAMARCYPGLLHARERLYRRIAHVTIDHDTRNRPDFGLKDLLAMAGSPERRP
jgi:shikimate kinase